MCDPLTLTLGGVALGVGGELMSAHAQNKASKENEKEARIAEALDINGINLRQTQEKAAASQDIQGAERQTAATVSAARVAAGEAGVAGASVDALMQAIGNEGSAYTETVRLNTKNTLNQLDQEKLGAASRARSRINSVPKANPFASALRIGAIGLNAATQIADRRPPSGK